MSAAALAARFDKTAPLEVRQAERLSPLFAPIRRMSPIMGAILVGSAAVHAVLVATAIVGARAPLVPPREIAVEIVQEAPKPLPKAPAPAAAPTKAAAMTPQPTAPAAPPRPAPAPPQPAQPKPAPPPAKADEPDLKSELERLRAEEARLKQQLAASQDAGTAAASGKAVALAAAGNGDGDPVGYQQIVFSQLAKAKDGDGFKGAVGTTGVRFEIAPDGALASVEVVTPSGDDALDREAVAIVHRAAPFPPPPKDAERSVFANVNFVAPRRP